MSKNENWITINKTHVLLEEGKSITDIFKERRLEEESKKWIKTLTKEQKRSIRKYTKNSIEEEGISNDNKFFSQLNYYLRTGINKSDIPTKTLEHYSKEISNAINKFELKEETLCYRRLNVDTFANYKVGDIVEPKMFISSSLYIDKAPKRKYTTVIFAKAGSKCAYIGDLSRINIQKEVLFDKSCKYKILLRKGNKTYVEVV